jgi:type IV secretory pathway VirB10-like protein
MLSAGTVISALLLTAVNSDLPGTLMAQVSRDVYDLRQRTVVLSRGTRLFGRYDNQIAVGQQRLLVAWTRLQLLDGTTLQVPGLGAVDPAGSAGLAAHVDNHVLRVFGDAVLLSLLGAGADLSQPAAAPALAAPSAGSVASAALGQQLSEAGTQLLRRDLAIQPTLTLPAGTPLAVFVNSDLPLEPHP